MDYFIFYSMPGKPSETADIYAQNITECFLEILKKFNKKIKSMDDFVYVYKDEKAFNNDDNKLFSLDSIEINKYKHIFTEYELPKIGEFWQHSCDVVVKIEKEEHNIHKEIEIYKIYMVDEYDIEKFESDKKEYSEKTALLLNATTEYLLLLK